MTLSPRRVRRQIAVGLGSRGAFAAMRGTRLGSQLVRRQYVQQDRRWRPGCIDASGFSTVRRAGSVAMRPVYQSLPDHGKARASSAVGLGHMPRRPFYLAFGKNSCCPSSWYAAIAVCPSSLRIQSMNAWPSEFLTCGCFAGLTRMTPYWLNRFGSPSTMIL
jgi:hypothetical protein